MCEDISIVDDRDVRPGVVSGGVSLLIRPAETKPTSPDIFQCGSLTPASNVPVGVLCRSDLKSDRSGPWCPFSIIDLKSDAPLGSHMARLFRRPRCLPFFNH